MTETQGSTKTETPAKRKGVLRKLKESWLSINLFRNLIRLTMIGAVVVMAYWLFMASDRYVSDANIVIRKTDSASAPSFDLGMLVSGVPGANRADQLLLQEYLQSLDMMKKLNTQLNLRDKYSGWSHDIVSRFWFRNAPIEWLYRYYRTMVGVNYDAISGTLHISAQAYDPATAHAMVKLMVEDGERFMNNLGHQLANTQVQFLTEQVKLTRDRFHEASQQLLNFQNKKQLLSPKASAENISTIIAGLQTERAKLETRLASLPKGLSPNHPTIVMIKQSLAAIDRQVNEERSKLTARSGGKLNTTLEEFQQLQMTVDFSKELYKSSLMALEKGRFDATRMLEKVSVLQSPTMPEYPMQPRRYYNAFVTFLAALLLIGMLKLLEAIVRDHVD